MESWRKAVIALLRAALRAGQLRTKMAIDQVEAMLTQQEKRWWSIKVQSFKSKERFLKYAGRYVRRPPIAQRRIHRGRNREVLGQRQKAAAPGLRRVLTGRVH